MNQFRLARRTGHRWVAVIWLLCAPLWTPPAWSQEPEQAPEDGQDAAAEKTEEETGGDTGEDAEQTTPEQQPRYGSRAERNRALLAARFPEEAQWLEVPQEEVLALYRPAERATSKGTLVLLHSAENPPHWPAHLANLRRALPRHGWATFALTLPLPEGPDIPPRPQETLPQPPAEENGETTEEGEEPLAEGAGQEQPLAEGTEEEQPLAEEEQPAAEAEEPLPEEDPLPPRAERIANHLDAALNWLRQSGQENLVILMDPASAPDVMAHLAPQLQNAAEEPAANGESPMPGPVRALILVTTHSGHELNRAQLEAVFAVPDLPVLDVILGPSARIEKRRREHRDASRRQQLNHYQQLHLRTPDIHDPEDEATRWVRRIHSYLIRQVQGVDVPINR